MFELTGLWLNRSVNGKKYMKGRIGKISILIFKNNQKQLGDNQPDYKLFISKKNKDYSKNQDKKFPNEIDDDVIF
jgi:hypothetical protein